MLGYLSLFVTAFAAASILPVGSEPLLAAMLVSKEYSVPLLILWSTLGNVLGGVLNWWLGKYLESYQDHRYFPVTHEQLDKAKNFYNRYGFWSLLLSWAPVIGDALTVFAGVMKEPLWRFTILVTLAKGGRYIIFAWMTLKAVELSTAN